MAFRFSRTKCVTFFVCIAYSARKHDLPLKNMIAKFETHTSCPSLLVNLKQLTRFKIKKKNLFKYLPNRIMATIRR